MSTPVLDQLSVNLAYRLGDPRDPQTGASITTTNLYDGLTYSQKDREQYLTLALRQFLNTVGHTTLQRQGYPKNYTLWIDEVFSAATDYILDLGVRPNMSRILDCYYFDKKMEVATEEMLKRRHHLYWQKVPMYDMWVSNMATGAITMRIYVPRTQDTVISIRYFRSIPLLVSGGTEDIMLSENLYPMIEHLAENTARRYHQEISTGLRREFDADMQALKENE